MKTTKDNSEQNANSAHKIELFDQATKISTNFLDIVPKPGVDYSKMTARMPEITVIEIVGSVFHFSPGHPEYFTRALNQFNTSIQPKKGAVRFETSKLKIGPF